MFIRGKSRKSTFLKFLFSKLMCVKRAKFVQVNEFVFNTVRYQVRQPRSSLAVSYRESNGRLSVNSSLF